jgi:hypothetical protein
MTAERIRAEGPADQEPSWKPAATIIGMLRIHPQVLANGRVADSPFYTPPERKLSH